MQRTARALLYLIRVVRAMVTVGITREAEIPREVHDGVTRNLFKPLQPLSSLGFAAPTAGNP
jgi:hypothetical protein